MTIHHFDEQQRFIIDNYDTARPFSSFLPGVAGPRGVPLWVFTVNRGQGIASFGVESKDQPIVEYQPANKAYQLTPLLGFRTFLKIADQLHEPFAPSPTPIERRMFIGMNELELQEVNHPIGLQTNLVYFTVPQENFAGLVRQVTFTNLTDRPLHLEVLDGLPTIAPYGVNNALLKDMSRTLEAWMEVFNLDQSIPFYRVRASVIDSAEVQAVAAGHFALAFVDGGDQAHQLPALVDPAIVFGPNTTLATPDRFIADPLASLFQQTQITVGKTPCAFFGTTIDLRPGQSITLHSVYGHVSDVAHLAQVRERVLSAARLHEMCRASNTLAQQLTDVIDTRTADPVFDAYCRQTFLDNVLRGGWPVIWEAGHPSTSGRAHAERNAVESKHARPSAQDANVYHLYSRKHGDLERDYNAFQLSAEYYSQGNGAYRDVNQNRRSDVFFEPRVGDFNLRLFMSLIQADGYNPLVIQGSTFTLNADQRAEMLQLVAQPELLQPTLSQPFTPGKLFKFILDHHLRLSVSPEEFLDRVMSAAAQQLGARFGEGYWIDHWAYNLDLIDSYLAVYPDRQQAVLFETALPFFDSAATVKPRAQKYVLANGLPRQYNALHVDEEKAALIAAREAERNWLRLDHGRGAVYRTTLFNKLAMLAAIKFATLDPSGMGIEMEAGKPGWDDAMNGLPGLFGSSLCETFELQRLIEFLRTSIAGSATASARSQQTAETRFASESLEFPAEFAALLHAVMTHLQEFNTSVDARRDFTYWDAVSTARENYRAAIRLGFSGEMQTLTKQELSEALDLYAAKVQSGVQRALELNDGVPPTYLIQRVEDYELIRDAAGQLQSDAQGRSFVRVKRFAPQVLPLFLEGPVHAFKVLPPNEVREIYNRIKSGPLFDQELKMYKVNASLADQPHEIGRARAFVPGWLENESIWLHMEYKYLLEVLRAGLYREFFEDFRAALVPFLDPQTYGRSPLENSSFIASSAHPDRSLHGAGFVARLSGSTAEFLSMWQLMMIGPQPFFLRDGELCLKFAPALPGWLFTADGTITFKLLGQCLVTIHNPQQVDTFTDEIQVRRIALIDRAGEQTEMAGCIIGAPWAARIRSGAVAHIDLYLEAS